MNLENILAYAVIILIIVLVAVVYNGIEEYNKVNKSKMSFMESMNLTGLPIVTFMIGSAKYNFLLDTGATFSIFNSSKLNEIPYTKSDRTSSIVGIDGTPKEANFANISLEYKNKIYKEDFQVLDMDASFNRIKEETGVSICGLLGSSFFQNNKYILDFKELIAYNKK